MRALRVALGIVNPPEGPPGREGLKSAIAARDRAQQAAEDARATVERLRAVILASDEAARLATVAVKKVDEARADWVSSGCKFSGTREIQSLEMHAAEAKRVADSTAADAKLVSKELARVESAYRSSQADLRFREEDIATEIGAIIAREALPLLERYEQVAEEYRKLRVRAKALQRVLDPDLYEDTTVKSHEGARLVVAALNRGFIERWDTERYEARARDLLDGQVGRDEAALEQLATVWRDRAAALRRDPDIA